MHFKDGKSHSESNVYSPTKLLHGNQCVHTPLPHRLIDPLVHFIFSFFSVVVFARCSKIHLMADDQVVLLETSTPQMHFHRSCFKLFQ